MYIYALFSLCFFTKIIQLYKLKCNGMISCSVSLSRLFSVIFIFLRLKRERRTQPLTEATTNPKEKKRKSLRQGTEETVKLK